MWLKVFDKPQIKNTSPHRFATDTAISWRTKYPNLDAPPNNVPLFPGQIVAVPSTANKCRLFVGSEDLSKWYEVES